MTEQAQIKLNGSTFTVDGITVGQLERITDAIETLPRHRIAFALLRIVMERAEPKPDKAVDDMTINALDLRAASVVIVKLAGLQQPNENPPKPDAP